MKSLGVQFSSEKQMRERATTFIGENLQTELAPMSFPLKGGGEELRNAPLSIIPHLAKKVEQLLDDNHK